MKKVCMISPQGYTGLGYYDFSLCYALTEKGQEIDLFSVDKHIVRKEPNFNLKHMFTDTYGGINRIKKGINYVRALLRCYKLVLNDDYEIIHFQIMEVPIIDLLFFVLLRLRKRKIVYTPHDIVPFKCKVYPFPVYLMYKLAHQLVVHNAMNKRVLVEYFGVEESRISIIPHGNYNIVLGKKHSKAAALKRLNLPSDRRILLFFGCIRKGKGLNVLLDAYRQVIERNDDVLLLIAGKRHRNFDLSTSFLDRYKKQVEFRHGFVPDEEVQYYYEAADLIILPYEEVFESGVLKYAFSCERPVLISDIEVFEDDMEDGSNSFVFRKGDPDSLANRIIEALNNREQMSLVAKNAKLYSDKQWDWYSIAEKTKECYEKIAD